MDPLFILNHIITFILTLYADPIIPRKIVQVFVDFMDSFIRNVFLSSIKKDILEALRNENISDSSRRAIDECFYKHSKIFEEVATEPKRFTFLKRKGFIDHEEFVVGQIFSQKCVGNEILLVPEVMYGIHVPLRKSLKLFLQIPGLLNKILQYIKDLSEEFTIITNIMQGDLWLKKYAKMFSKTIVLPLYVFYDELEVGNPLGSHAGKNKFGAVYVSLACLPPYIVSRINSIIFSTLVHAGDKKKSDNQRIFQRLIAELNQLADEGITLNVNGVQTCVKSININIGRQPRPQ